MYFILHLYVFLVLDLQVDLLTTIETVNIICVQGILIMHIMVRVAI